MFSVIFDMDGTLLDTQRICVPAWEYAGRKQGIIGMGEHVYTVCGMNENGSTAYLKNNFKDLDVPVFKSQIRKYIIDNGVVRFKPGAEELLGFLKENHIKIALASGTSRNSINSHLSKLGIEGCFDAIVGGGDVENGKPAPDVFLKAAGLIGAAPETCFVFEDSANGIRAGHAAGMKCIGVADLVEFDSQTKELMFTEFKTLFEGIEFFKKYI